MRKSFLLFPLLLLAACGGSSQRGDSGTLEVVATDAPIDPSLVLDARLVVEKVRVHAETDADDDSDGWRTLFDGPPMLVRFFELRNGITEEIASGRLPAGTYRQFRIHLAGGELELRNGNLYSTEDGTLKMPSSMTSSGYKVFLDPPVEIPAGGVEQVVLDFDLANMFQPIPADDFETARLYNLRPKVRAAVTSISGDLRGTVRRDDGMGTLVAVPDALFFVLAPGEMDPANAIATTITDDTGSAMVLGLLPGVYDVVAREGGTEARVDGVQVVTGETSSVDLVLP